MQEHAPAAAAEPRGFVERSDQSDVPGRNRSAPGHSGRTGWDVGFKKFLWNNGLSLVVLGLFVFTIVGQVGTGLLAYNNEQREHGEPVAGLGEYLTTGHFIEATAENWESEFLQMGMFVILTVFLRQKGSAESKKPDGRENVDEDPRDHAADPDAPWPVRKGGFVLRLYSNSLFIAFVLLFLISFVGHAWGGALQYSEEQLSHGQEAVTTLQFMGSSQFWFESFQNWQSEFLSIAAMVLFTIWLRQYGSPESKPVHYPHAKTSTE